MHDFKKRAFVLSVIISIILSLSACGLNSKNRVTQSSVISNNAQIIIEGIETGEYESISEIFSPYVKEHYPNLGSDIAELMKYIDGDIVSYESVISSSRGGHSTPEGWDEKSIEGEIRNIKTSTDKTYTIRFGGYYIYKDKPDQVGVQYIIIISNDTLDDEGYPEKKSVYYR